MSTALSTALTTAQAAELLGVSTRKVALLAASGELPYAHKGAGIRGPYLFDRAVVEMYQRQHQRRRRKTA